MSFRPRPVKKIPLPERMIFGAIPAPFVGFTHNENVSSNPTKPAAARTIERKRGLFATMKRVFGRAK